MFGVNDSRLVLIFLCLRFGEFIQSQGLIEIITLVESIAFLRIVVEHFSILVWITESRERYVAEIISIIRIGGILLFAFDLDQKFCCGPIIYAKIVMNGRRIPRIISPYTLG